MITCWPDRICRGKKREKNLAPILKFQLYHWRDFHESLAEMRRNRRTCLWVATCFGPTALEMPARYLS